MTDCFSSQIELIKIYQRSGPYYMIHIICSIQYGTYIMVQNDDLMSTKNETILNDNFAIPAHQQGTELNNQINHSSSNKNFVAIQIFHDRVNQ